MSRAAPLENREAPDPGLPPRLLGPVPILQRIGVLALPSVTISVGSAITLAACMAFLYIREWTRFFFRLSWPSMRLAAPSTLLCIVIVWVCSQRPGRQPFPRGWALWLAWINLVLLGFSVTQWRQGAETPQLHAMVVSVAASTLVLSARLVRVHPISAKVQWIAQSALVTVLIPTIAGMYWLLQREIVIEQSVIIGMANGFREQGAKLNAVATFPFNAGHADRTEAENILNGLDPLHGLAFPDARRWEGARILTLEGRLKPGELEKSAVEFMDAVRGVYTSRTAPVLRVARFVAGKGDAEPYIRIPTFEVNARTALVYHAQAKRWRQLMEAFAGGPLDAHHSLCKGEMENFRGTLEASPETFWLAVLLRPDGSHPTMAELFSKKIGRVALADLDYWRGLTFGGAMRMRGARSKSWSNPKEITVPRSDGMVDVQIVYDVWRWVAFFAYYPQMGDRDPLVIETRLDYEEHDQTRDNMPRDTPVARLQLIVEAPPGADLRAFQAEVITGLTESLRQSSDVQLRSTGGPNFDQGFSWSRRDQMYRATPRIIQKEPGASAITIEVTAMPQTGTVHAGN